VKPEKMREQHLFISAPTSQFYTYDAAMDNIEKMY
jgi:hypothetical protein